MKTKIISILALLIAAATGAWANNADDEVPVTPTANDNEWTLTIPASDVELEVEYYTDLLETIANDYTTISGQKDIWLGRTLQAGGWNTFA